MVFQKLVIGKAKIDVCTLKEAAEYIINLALKKEFKSYIVVTPNADHIVQLENNKELQKVYEKSKLIVPDGMPLIWVSRFLGVKLKERVCGSDLLPLLCQMASKQNLSIYLFGGLPKVAEIAAQKLQKQNPNLQVVGTYCPPFGFEKNEIENNKIIEQINNAKPDLLFVGVGAPKQEIWMHNNQTKLQCGIMLGIGAGIGFMAGTDKRAPLFLQKLGLEWFYRLLNDPKRLTKRYLKDLMFFVIAFKSRKIDNDKY